MAAGDCCILREVTAGEVDTSLTWAEYSWDDEVYRDSGSFSLSGSTGIECTDAGPYLVIYNNSYAGGGSNRSELANRIEVDGTRTLSGQTTSYIRRSGDTYSSQCGIGLIEATAGQVVTIARARTDSNTAGATCTRQALECGFQVVKLDDAWSYFRAIDLTSQSLTHASGESPPVTAASFEWQDVLLRTEFRQDTGFLHSTTVNPAEITLDGARRYLILYSVKFSNASGSVRVNGMGRLVYDGVQVPASVSTAYARGSDGCQDPVACGAVIYSPAGRNKVLKLQAACDQEGTGTLSVNEASIDIIDLGLDIDVAILRQSADHDHNVAISAWDPISWDTQDAIDTAAFTHSTTSNPHEVEIAASGRYLAISSFFQVRTAVNTVRKRPRVKFRRYVPALTAYNYYGYGYGDNFNRGDQTTTSSWTAGGIGAGVFELQTNDLFEACGCDPASTLDSDTAWAAGDCGLFLIDLSTMDSTPAPITGVLDATTPAPTASVDGSYTPEPITGVLDVTVPSCTASLSGTYTPPAITGALDASTPAVAASISGSNGGPAPITGSLDVVTPTVTASFDGVFPAPITGTIELDVPSVTAGFAGTYLAPITGTLSATTPSLIAGFVGTKSVDPITGTISATLPLVRVALYSTAPGRPVPLGIRAALPAQAEDRGALTGVWRQREAL